MNSAPRQPALRAARNIVVVLAFAVIPLSVAPAQTIDAAGDFLPTYTGPRNPIANGDMDILRAQVFFDGRNFLFTSTSAGNISSTPGAFFVWGMNRGAGTARFSTLAPGVLFDWVLSITPGGAISTRDLISGVSTTIDASSVTISGANITALIPATLLPSQGFSLADFTANLWPRVPGGLEGISDFAPDNSNMRVTVTPEPATFALMATGMFGLLAARRRRRV